MRVKLVSYTKPSVELSNEDISNLQDLVAYCARVSNPSNQFNTETSDKLIGYLVRNGHWSPLEMVSICLEIETTRDIARQILRHRSFTFQEFSQRYSDPTKELDFVLRECRLQDTKNRQNSTPIDLSDDDHRRTAYQWEILQKNLIEQAKTVYQWAVEKGIAKEQARCVLPEGNTVSRLYIHGSLRSWVHYIQLRSGNGTQKEHIEVAKECAKVISDVFPNITNFIQK